MIWTQSIKITIYSRFSRMERHVVIESVTHIEMLDIISQILTKNS